MPIKRAKQQASNLGRMFKQNINATVKSIKNIPRNTKNINVVHKKQKPLKWK